MCLLQFHLRTCWYWMRKEFIYLIIYWDLTMKVLQSTSLAFQQEVSNTYAFIWYNIYILCFMFYVFLWLYIQVVYISHVSWHLLWFLTSRINRHTFVKIMLELLLTRWEPCHSCVVFHITYTHTVELAVVYDTLKNNCFCILCCSNTFSLNTHALFFGLLFIVFYFGYLNVQ